MRNTDKEIGKINSIASCNCGTIKMLSENYALNSIVCEGCGNKKFLSMRKGERVLYPYVELINKSMKGFKVKRTNLSVLFDDDFNVLTKANMIQVLQYNMSNGTIQIWKNGEHKRLLKPYHECDTYRRFFTNVNDIELKSLISVAETESLYEMAFEELSKGKNWSSPRRFYIGLSKLFNHQYLQILSNAGYTNVKRFNRTGWGHSNTINKNGTSPKDIFGVPKFFLNYIRENEDIGTYEIKQVKEALKKVEVNRFKELLEIVKDESTIRELTGCLDTLTEIHDTYNYNNVKKLTLYLFREIRMTQGIVSPSNGASLLRDYIRMSTKLGQEFDKYPKSLKKEHDITQLNYKVKESAMKQQEFLDAVKSEEYIKNKYKSAKYLIIPPSEMDDLIKEGNELSHCVASYVESINTSRCQIYFLRDVENPDKSLATIEVRGQNVRQARGYANRALKREEREFIAEWANKKQLDLNYYY